MQCCKLCYWRSIATDPSLNLQPTAPGHPSGTQLMSALKQTCYHEIAG